MTREALCLFAGATSCGDVFEPRAPPTEEPRLGSVGSIEANAEGVAVFDIENSKVALTGPESIFGRSFVVRSKPRRVQTPAA